jgi:hypothetical protein
VREYVGMCVIQFIADLFSLEPLAKNCKSALAGQALNPRPLEPFFRLRDMRYEERDTGFKICQKSNGNELDKISLTVHYSLNTIHYLLTTVHCSSFDSGYS